MSLEIPIAVVVTLLIMYFTVAMLLSFGIIVDNNYKNSEIIILSSLGWLPAIIVQLLINGLREIKSIRHP